MFPKIPRNKRNLGRTNNLINSHDCANPTSLFPVPLSSSISLGLGFSLLCDSLEIDLCHVLPRFRILLLGNLSKLYTGVYILADPKRSIPA